MEQFRSLGRERARLADVVEEVGRLTTRHAESVELLAISIVKKTKICWSPSPRRLRKLPHALKI